VTEHTIRCLLCEGREEEPAAEYLAHARETHPELLNAEGGLTGRRTDAQHLDWPDRYINSYVYVKDDLKFCVSTHRGMRDEDDPMRFG